MRKEYDIERLNPRENFYTKMLEEAEEESKKTTVRFTSAEVLEAMRAEK